MLQCLMWTISVKLLKQSKTCTTLKPVPETASFKYENFFSTHLLFLLGNSGELGLDDPSDFRSKKVPGLSNTLCILSVASLLGEKRNQLYPRARVNYHLFSHSLTRHSTKLYVQYTHKREANTAVLKRTDPLHVSCDIWKWLTLSSFWIYIKAWIHFSIHL